jgi:hypothetical protein
MTIRADRQRFRRPRDGSKALEQRLYAGGRSRIRLHRELIKIARARWPICAKRLCSWPRRAAGRSRSGRPLARSAPISCGAPTACGTGRPTAYALTASRPWRVPRGSRRTAQHRAPSSPARPRTSPRSSGRGSRDAAAPWPGDAMIEQPGAELLVASEPQPGRELPLPGDTHLVLNLAFCPARGRRARHRLDR